MPMTIGELRAALKAEGVAWRPDEALADHEPIARRALGADAPIEPSNEPPFDLRRLGPGGNPFLSVRRADLGLVTTEQLLTVIPDDEIARLRKAMVQRPPKGRPRTKDPAQMEGGGGTPRGGAHPASVDWRNRFGRNWVTTIRDQDGCNACWAFTGTALVEAMTVIEHATWTLRSEGDVHDGIGKHCADLGNLGEVSNFIANHGLADPGSWPFRTDDAAYAPTPDRDGRTVRAPAFTTVNSVDDQKSWIDTVGPLATWFDVFDDFFAWHGPNPYVKSNAPTNGHAGGHFMLVVGYDDGLQAWLCKNSWGTGYGESGFYWIRYGECGIDGAKLGLRDTNPDPWTKRRLHNGNLYESGNGALHRNLEVAGATGGRVTLHWREGGPPWTWSQTPSFATDAAACPTLTGTTFGRNMELVYLTNGGQLHHWWRAGGGGNWNNGPVFGANVRGLPGFIQGDYGAPGNFEVVVAEGSQLRHYWRDGAFNWHQGPLFGGAIALSGPSLVQGQYGSPHGNLEVVACLNDGHLRHFWRDSAFNWHDGATFGAGIASPPVMIQGQFGMANEMGLGNFELCVAIGGQVQHWWRNNGVGAMPWNQGPTFGHDVQAVAGLCEGSWGMNLEMMVLRTDGQLQHYWRDGAFVWHEGPAIGQA